MRIPTRVNAFSRLEAWTSGRSWSISKLGYIYTHAQCFTVIGSRLFVMAEFSISGATSRKRSAFRDEYIRYTMITFCRI